MSPTIAAIAFQVRFGPIPKIRWKVYCWREAYRVDRYGNKRRMMAWERRELRATRNCSVLLG
jgi:hypothetical protein